MWCKGKFYSFFLATEAVIFRKRNFGIYSIIYRKTIPYTILHGLYIPRSTVNIRIRACITAAQGTLLRLISLIYRDKSNVSSDEFMHRCTPAQIYFTAINIFVRQPSDLEGWSPLLHSLITWLITEEIFNLRNVVNTLATSTKSSSSGKIKQSRAYSWLFRGKFRTDWDRSTLLWPSGFEWIRLW